jgi:hypothetical protein
VRVSYKYERSDEVQIYLDDKNRSTSSLAQKIVAGKPESE